MIRILFLSDLHATDPLGEAQEILAGEALKDADFLSAGHIDLLVFGGDLARTGRLAEYERARSLLLEPAMKRFGLRPETVLLAAGNHDDVREMGLPGLRATLRSQAQVDALLDDRDEVFRATGGLRQWETFVRRFYGNRQPVRPGPLSFVRSFEIDNTSVGIAVLNSAWLTEGEDDEGRLILGRRQVEPALRAISGSDLRLVVVHHPLDSLVPFDAHETRAAFARAGVIVLSGHLHIPEAMSQRSAGGEILTVRAGSLDGGRKHPNRYSIVEIDPATGTVDVRYQHWYESRQAFDADLDAAPGGRQKFPLPLPGRARQLGHPPFSEVAGRIDEAAERLRLDSGRKTGEIASTDGVLVKPRFLDASGREVDPLEQVANHDVTVVSGHSQGGVTSALYWLLRENHRLDTERIPVYQSARDSAIGTAKADAVLAKIDRFGFDRSAVRDGLRMQAYDDVDSVSEKRRARILDSIVGNPKHHHLLGDHGEGSMAIVQPLVDAGASVNQVFLGTCGQAELNELARTVAGGTEVDLDRVAAAIRNLDLPRDPSTVLTLIAASAGREDAAPPSDSCLLESYTEQLLGAGGTGPRSLWMDRRMWIHMLAALANALYQVPDETLSRRDAEHILMAYFHRKARPKSAGEVLADLVSRGVLIVRNTRIAFRNPALLHLFKAHWVAEHPDCAAGMLQDCHAHREVIRHMSWIRRDSRDTLRCVTDHAKREIASLAPAGSDDVNEMLGRFEPTGRLTNEWVDAFMSLLPPRTTKTVLDAESDRIAAAFKHEGIALDGPSAGPVERLAEANALLSDVLRHSELVDGVELKRESFATALTGWAMQIRAFLVEGDDESKSFGRLVSEQISDELGERALGEVNREMLVATVAVTTCSLAVQERLASPSLEEIVEHTLDDEEFMRSTTAGSLATWLHARLELGGWPRRLGDQLERLPEGSLLWDATVATAISHYRSCSSEADVRAIESILIDAIAPRFGSGSVAMRREQYRQEVRHELIHGRRAYRSARPARQVEASSERASVVSR